MCEDTAVPSVQALTGSGHVSLLFSAPGQHILPSLPSSALQFWFLLGCEKTRVLNKLEPRKESPSERGSSYEGQNRVEVFVLDSENLGERL